MKLASRTFKIQWDLHAWSGVVASALLFVIFYCGVFALFHDAFQHWQAPATAPSVSRPTASHVSYERVVSRVEQDLAIPRGATVMLRLPLGPSVEPGFSTVSVYHEPSGLGRDFLFDRISGEPGKEAAEHSRLAEELYALHFFYQVPGGVELSGFVAVALFVALVSGVVIHWKDLLRQIWQFRPRLRLRFSASDAHKVLGVFGLPFATLFAWSGALLGLGTLLALPLQYGAYGGSSKALDEARGYRASSTVESGRAAARLSLDDLVTRGMAAAGAHFQSALPLHPERMDIELYGDEAARFRLSFVVRGFEPPRGVELDRDAHVLRFIGDTSAPTEAVDRILFDFHFARFGGYLVKGLFALLALAVCTVIVTGNIVWLERRDLARSRVGNRLLARATVGVCFGLVVASAIYCVSNRVLPAALPARADLEFGSFIAAWLLCIAGVFTRGSTQSWARGLSGTAGLAFVAVVLSDGLLRPALLAAALRGDGPPILAAELALLALAVLCLSIARGLGRRQAYLENGSCGAQRSSSSSVDHPGTDQRGCATPSGDSSYTSVDS